MTSVASEPLEPSGRNRHQLWDPRDVPVRVRDLCVPEVRRERSDALLDIDAVAVPAEKTTAGERVAEIVEPRSSPEPRGGWDHAVDQGPADSAHGGVGQRLTLLSNEEWRPESRPHDRVLPCHVATQLVPRGRMERNEPRLAELGEPDRE